MSKTNSYVDRMGVYFDKLPDLSASGRSAIVGLLPWLSLFFGIIGIAIAIVGLGIFTIFEPVAQITGVKGAGQSFFFVLLSLVSSILLLSAYPGVQKKKEVGWRRVYYSEVIALINDVLTFSVGGILLSLVGFYILYQIRSHYK